MWLEDTYMAGPFMAQYAREFDQSAWSEEVVRQIILLYNRLGDPSTGLLYHAWDEHRKERWCDPETGRSTIFWGRGMGWYMMALVDVLDYLPENSAGRDSVLVILNKTADALLKVRDKETGLWYQVLDQGGKEGNYLEASCSCMFTYVFAKGADQNYLPEKYHKIAEETFAAILNNMVSENKDGLLTLKHVCSSCVLGGEPYRDGSYDYYTSVKQTDNDPKGIAAFILAAVELRN